MEPRRIRLVGAAGTLLIVEGALWLALQFLTLVYLIGNQVNVPDEEHRPLAPLALWLLISSAAFAFAMIAGLAMRRRSERGWLVRVSLIVAAIANAVVVVASVHGVLTQRRYSAESTVAWLVVAGVALVVILGIIALFTPSPGARHTPA